MVLDELRPDLTIILDLDPETGLARATERGELDRFENEKNEFFEKVRSAYLDIATSNPERCFVIDANQSIGQISADIINLLDNRLFSD